MTDSRIEHALLSVSDKTGLLNFAQNLISKGVKLYASGGTRLHLQQAGVAVEEVSEYTAFPEMMDGRIKTLHPKIHGGILCRRDHPADQQALREHGIVPFDLVVVNLYPFAETIARQGVTPAEATEQIDIGGPTLIRGAAKNHAYVTVACHPSQYDEIWEQICTTGSTTMPLRRCLAAAAFAHTASYDVAIADYFDRLNFAALAAGNQPNENQPGDDRAPQWPGRINLSLTLKNTLRYGENPHQQAALYAHSVPPPGALVTAQQLHGKELSYNNLLDLNSALSIARSLPVPGVAVLKHNNPCGAATASTTSVAVEHAWEGDSQSAFGSVLGFNAPVDESSAEFLAAPGRFVEAIIAPDFTAEAIEVLTTKPNWKANVRLIKVGAIQPGAGDIELRPIDGGFLAQQMDDLPDDDSQWNVVTTAQPSTEQLSELKFAWSVVRHVKSNAIVLTRDQSLVGAGAGQMSRVDSVEIAIRKAGERAQGAVLASDAFFPFDDSIHRAAQVGISAIIQPGGSRRDQEVLDACNHHQLPMVFTGRRHFRH